MDSFLGPGLDIEPIVGPQVVIANNILLYNAADLEQSLDQELSENPALELAEVARCPRCGAELPNGEQRFCARCNSQIREAYPLPWERRRLSSAAATGDHDWADPLARVAAPTTMTDYLLWQLGPTLNSEEERVARFLMESLDERGFLACSEEEASAALGVPAEDVRRIICRIQELEPSGIGARNAQECLLIQLKQLKQQGFLVPPLACRLVQECWAPLSRGAVRQVQRRLGATGEEIQGVLQFLAENLTPYPAMSQWEISPAGCGNTKGGGMFVRPDIVLTENGDGQIEIDLPQARGFELRINHLFGDLAGSRVARRELTETQYYCVRDCVDRARLFIRGMEQRWVTLKAITLALLGRQDGFVRRGPRYIRPLTRAQLAASLGLHESIVSRAVANKYVQLPNNKIIPMSTFFDDSLAVKDVIAEIVEGEGKTLSDQEIASELAERGYRVARRTVAKYRDAMGILPASLRFKKRWPT